MYDINDFIERTDQALPDDHDVLVWSIESGYFFTQYKLVGDKKIVGERNV